MPTPDEWHEHAAVALRREQAAPRCAKPLDYLRDRQRPYLVRIVPCNLRRDHRGGCQA